jgi:hypothetical protein
LGTLARYFITSANTHNSWAGWMVFCEFLNLFNVIFNIYFINVFLGGEFLVYGADVVSFLSGDQSSRRDPMARWGSVSWPSSHGAPQYSAHCRVFPRMTKCTNFKSFGPSGTIQVGPNTPLSALKVFDALCMLPINVMNEKIYVFFWLWLYLLAIVTAVFMVYRLALVLNTSFLSATIRHKIRHRFEWRHGV